MPHQDLATRLLQSYREESVAHGVSVDGTLLEIFASPEGTYTAVKVTPKGHACIVDFGAAWQLQRNDGNGASLDNVPALQRLIHARQ